MTIKFEFNFGTPSLLLRAVVGNEMSFLDSLFGRPRPEPVKPSTPPAESMTEEKVKLQSGIDKTNTRIQGYQKKAADARNAAKRYKKNGNMVMATQMLNKEKQFLDLIKTANVSISHRDQKMMIMEKSELIIETHDDITAVDGKLKDMISGRLDVSTMQGTLIDSETIGNEVNELASYMENTSPFADANNLDNELDNLSLSDDETDIDYDFPAVTRTNTGVSINTTTTSTTKIPEITKSDIMGML